VDVYEVVIGLHIVGAVVLEISTVGLLGSMVILEWGRRARSSMHAVTGARLFDKGIPAGAALVLVTGLYMVVNRWGMREPWLIASLAALVAVAPLAPLLISPEVKKLQTRSQSRARSPHARKSARHGRALVPTAVLTGVSIAEVVVMTTKPQGIAAATTLILAAIVGGLLAIAYLLTGLSQ
jgi:Predicted integral membrane protein (DUF2269)